MAIQNKCDADYIILTSNQNISGKDNCLLINNIISDGNKSLLFCNYDINSISSKMLEHSGSCFGEVALKSESKIRVFKFIDFIQAI